MLAVDTHPGCAGRVQGPTSSPGTELQQERVLVTTVCDSRCFTQCRPLQSPSALPSGGQVVTGRWADPLLPVEVGQLDKLQRSATLAPGAGDPACALLLLSRDTSFDTSFI